MQTRTLRAHEVRELSVAAMVDPRTIRKYLTGSGTIAGVSIRRIESALRRLGWSDICERLPQRTERGAR